MQNKRTCGVPRELQAHVRGVPVSRPGAARSAFTCELPLVGGNGLLQATSVAGPSGATASRATVHSFCHCVFVFWASSVCWSTHQLVLKKGAVIASQNSCTDMH